MFLTFETTMVWFYIYICGVGCGSITLELGPHAKIRYVHHLLIPAQSIPSLLYQT